VLHRPVESAGGKSPIRSIARRALDYPHCAQAAELGIRFTDPNQHVISITKSAFPAVTDVHRCGAEAQSQDMWNIFVA